MGGSGLEQAHVLESHLSRHVSRKRPITIFLTPFFPVVALALLYSHHANRSDCIALAFAISDL
jgi:hypothetical protein